MRDLLWKDSGMFFQRDLPTARTWITAAVNFASLVSEASAATEQDATKVLASEFARLVTSRIPRREPRNGGGSELQSSPRPSSSISGTPSAGLPSVAQPTPVSPLEQVAAALHAKPAPTAPAGVPGRKLGLSAADSPWLGRGGDKLDVRAPEASPAASKQREQAERDTSRQRGTRDRPDSTRDRSRPAGRTSEYAANARASSSTDATAKSVRRPSRSAITPGDKPSLKPAASSSSAPFLAPGSESSTPTDTESTRQQPGDAAVDDRGSRLAEARSVIDAAKSNAAELSDGASDDSPSHSSLGRRRHPARKANDVAEEPEVYLSEKERAAARAAMQERADLRQPHLWYPVARAMKRKLIYHAGPTNSGKTYNALQALKTAWSGVYCGPLRLLALEVFESLNYDGTYCSLMTGQDKRTMPFAKHIACTVEMMDVETVVDVAVIDEIQMIGDDSRGSAWTRAVLGAPAKEVHLCGDPAAVHVVEALCKITGDEFEVKRYERMTSITVMKESIKEDFSDVQEGDAIVAFSRKNIYAIKKQIERSTHHKCCVVYGSLPPETRSAQARLFNDPNSGYRVLVASDAIGMGLNLNIRRVIFHTIEKFDGVEKGLVPPAHVKQIAGRAGRRSSIYPEGFATTLDEESLPYVRECMATPSEPITTAGLFPNPEQLLAFSTVLKPGTPLSTVLDRFLESSQLEGPYFMCRSDAFKEMARALQPIHLPLERRALLMLAPFNTRDLDVKQWYLRYVKDFSMGLPVRLGIQLPIIGADPTLGASSSNTGSNSNNNDVVVDIATDAPRSGDTADKASLQPQLQAAQHKRITVAGLQEDLTALETKAAALDIYLWLAHRFGSTASFPDLGDALAKR